MKLKLSLLLLTLANFVFANPFDMPPPPPDGGTGVVTPGSPVPAAHIDMYIPMIALFAFLLIFYVVHKHNMAKRKSDVFNKAVILNKVKRNMGFF